MRPHDIWVELADVVDVVDLGWVRVDAALDVADHGVVLPAALEQLVEHIDVLLGAPVTVVVDRQPAVAEVARGVLEIGGDDVPRHPPLREVIERGDAAREVERVLLQHGVREREPEVLGRVGHRRDQQRGIVEGDLQALLDGRVAIAAVTVVGADHVGEEQRVELPALEELRELYPRVKARIVELTGVIAHPLAVVDVRDAVHGEGVETKAALGHL